jgi:hypothetical protein
MASNLVALEWFLQYNIALEVVFGSVALMVALFAWRIYKESDQKRLKLFGISFLLISASYFLQAMSNFLAISELEEFINLIEFVPMSAELQSVVLLESIGVYAHMFMMISGLVILVYMTFRKEKQRILYLLLALSMLSVFMSDNIVYMFYLLSSILSAFVLWYYAENYRRGRRSNVLPVFVAFFFLFLGNVCFIFSCCNIFFYAIGHVFELFAYLFIIWNLRMVLKNDQKRPARDNT